MHPELVTKMIFLGGDGPTPPPHSTPLGASPTEILNTPQSPLHVHNTSSVLIAEKAYQLGSSYRTCLHYRKPVVIDCVYMCCA